MNKTETKLLDMIPEALREDFIEEVRQLISEEGKEKKLSDTQAIADIKAWSAKNKINNQI